MRGAWLRAAILAAIVSVSVGCTGTLRLASSLESVVVTNASNCWGELWRNGKLDVTMAPWNTQNVLFVGNPNMVLNFKPFVADRATGQRRYIGLSTQQFGKSGYAFYKFSWDIPAVSGCR